MERRLREMEAALIRRMDDRIASLGVMVEMKLMEIRNARQPEPQFEMPPVEPPPMFSYVLTASGYVRNSPGVVETGSTYEPSLAVHLPGGKHGTPEPTLDAVCAIARVESRPFLRDMFLQHIARCEDADRRALLVTMSPVEQAKLYAEESQMLKLYESFSGASPVPYGGTMIWRVVMEEASRAIAYGRLTNDQLRIAGATAVFECARGQLERWKMMHHEPEFAERIEYFARVIERFNANVEKCAPVPLELQTSEEEVAEMIEGVHAAAAEVVMRAEMVDAARKRRREELTRELERMQREMQSLE